MRGTRGNGRRPRGRTGSFASGYPSVPVPNTSEGAVRLVAYGFGHRGSYNPGIQMPVPNSEASLGHQYCSMPPPMYQAALNAAMSFTPMFSQPSFPGAHYWNAPAMQIPPPATQQFCGPPLTSLVQVPREPKTFSGPNASLYRTITNVPSSTTIAPRPPSSVSQTRNLSDVLDEYDRVVAINNNTSTDPLQPLSDPRTPRKGHGSASAQSSTATSDKTGSNETVVNPISTTPAPVANAPQTNLSSDANLLKNPLFGRANPLEVVHNIIKKPILQPCVSIARPEKRNRSPSMLDADFISTKEELQPFKKAATMKNSAAKINKSGSVKAVKPDLAGGSQNDCRGNMQELQDKSTDEVILVTDEEVVELGSRILEWKIDSEPSAELQAEFDSDCEIVENSEDGDTADVAADDDSQDQGAVVSLLLEKRLPPLSYFAAGLPILEPVPSETSNRFQSIKVIFESRMNRERSFGNQPCLV